MICSKEKVRRLKFGTSLEVQLLRLCASTAWGTGLILGQGTKIPHAARWLEKKKSKKTKFILKKKRLKFIWSKGIELQMEAE